MNLEEFNQAVNRCYPKYTKAMTSRSSIDIGDYLLALTLEGIVVLPLVEGEDLPEPLARIQAIPNESVRNSDPTTFHILCPACQLKR